MSGPKLIRLGGETYRKTADLPPEPDPKSSGRATTRRKTQLQQDVADLEGKVKELKRQISKLWRDEQDLRRTILIEQDRLRILNGRVTAARQGLQQVKDKVTESTLTGFLLGNGDETTDQKKSTKPRGRPKKGIIPSIDPEDEYTPPKRPKKALKRGPVKAKKQVSSPSNSAPFIDNPYVVDLESPTKAPDVLVDQENSHEDAQKTND